MGMGGGGGRMQGRHLSRVGDLEVFVLKMDGNNCRTSEREEEGRRREVLFFFSAVAVLSSF